MPAQQTIKQAVEFSGIGLHSGNKVSLRFLPAAANTGIRFRRVDLDGKPEIEARVENVSDTSRSTTLARGNVRIHTVEHVLATFAGYGIDNVMVELDANEPPIADGSSREYCRMVQEAGIVAQTAPCEPYRVTEPIELRQGETVMTVFPSDSLRITCTSADEAGRFAQFYSCEVTPATWEKELAHARTFCFFEEIEHLIKHGFIKGGSLENSIIIRDDAVLTTEPLRYPEEFVRHKMLDIVGDLALLGRPILAHVTATRPSHAANCELARLIQAQIRRPALAAQTFSPPPAASEPAAPPAREEDGCEMTVEQVMQTLPHRHPFLLLDRVAKIEGSRIVAVKNVSIGEPFFQGHFPGHPIMPGVLQLEAIAQAAGILLIRKAQTSGNMIAYFMAAENVKWRKPVVPGDTLVIEVELIKARGKIGRARGVCRVRGDIVSEAEVTFMIVAANAA